MKPVNINKIVNKRSSFKIKDTTIVTIIIKIDNTYHLNINLNKKGTQFYNFFNRELESIDDQYYLTELFIIHPPFKFHSSDILVNNSLDFFWNKVIESLYDESYSSNIAPNYLPFDREDGIYFKCFKKLTENQKMSENIKNKLSNIIDTRAVDYIIQTRQTAVFTNDLTKAKSLKMALNENRK